MASFSQHLVRILVGLALLLLAIGVASAQLPTPGRNAIASELVAETDTPAAGSTVTLALVMRPDEGWHGYWQNPGDAGQEMQVHWRLPEGVSAGPLAYPVPQTLTIAGLMNYVYEGDYAQLVQLTIPPGLAEGTRLPIAARLEYLACTDQICVPEKAEVALTLTVGAPGAPLTRRAEFDRYRQALPRPLGSEARFEHAGERLRLAIPIPAALPVDDVYFFPLTEDAVAYAASQAVSRNGDYLILEIGADRDIGDLAVLEGVLRIGDGQGLAVSAVPGPVPAAGTPIVGSAAQPQAGQARLLLLALLGAVAGGVILNVMPCVFPILSLKAMSLVRAGEGERAARHEALAYTAGVVLTCLALGGLLLALRAGGEAAGWAFQLQDPRVILLLFLLVTAIALNLAGLYELPAITGGSSLTARQGVGGAFWTGALAAFVATPCTGPFMGAALGAALVLPGAAALAIFAGLGFGLALPFLALGFVPALRRRLPKPGPWMARFRHWMAVPMALTALGLAWILSRQAGAGGLAIGLAAAVLLAAALWAVGRRQGRDRAWLPLAPAGAAALGALLVLPAVTAPAAASAAVLGAEPFSEARLAALRAEGRPVFVYFTADWCVTCKVNEKAVLDREDVAAAFDEHDVAVLVGDWTNGDAAISRFLEKHGRSGVPLYLYYPPGKPVQVLPQILTTGTLTDLIA